MLTGRLFAHAQRSYYAYIWTLGKLLGWRKRGGETVMGKEWDNLLVLDACRADTFHAVNTIPGTFETVRSVATETPQWLKRNFERDCSDTVYVAGNPYVSKLASDGYFDAEQHFHHVEHVWDEGWDDETGTVLPGTMNDAARRMVEEYPDKRLIVHYMQPHEPFIGEPPLDRPRPGWRGRYEMWRDPSIPDAYRGNLELVLGGVETLLPDLDGTTVITGDHGEILDAKYGLIGHPKDVFIRDLYAVPWFVVDMDAV